MRLGYPQLFIDYFFNNRPRFNEAEAHAPRIQDNLWQLLYAARRFNEAEAHAPRIRGDGSQARTITDAASMRPRRMRLGYLECLI